MAKGNDVSKRKGPPTCSSRHIPRLQQVYPAHNSRHISCTARHANGKAGKNGYSRGTRTPTRLLLQVRAKARLSNIISNDDIISMAAIIAPAPCISSP